MNKEDKIILIEILDRCAVHGNYDQSQAEEVMKRVNDLKVKYINGLV